MSDDQRNHMRQFDLSRLLAGAILALSLVVSSTSSLRAQEWLGPNSFTGIYAFGDSLTDTGNLFALTGFPPEPYFEGHISNGIVWIEYLAISMQLDTGSVINYAFAGATTGRDNELDIPGTLEFPGLQDELDSFEAELDGNLADPTALYIVWAGANDVFRWGPSEETMTTAIENTMLAVERLHSVGAPRILVVNLPDLGLTPYGRSEDPFGLSLFSAVYNDQLDAALDGLAAAGIQTIRLDSSALLQEVVAQPQQFGFTNVTDAYLSTSGSGDPSEFLFWDDVHPTTRGHFFIAEETMRVLRQKFRYRR